MAGVDNGDFDDTERHFQFLQNGTEDAVTCQIGEDGRLPKSWILLDNQSTVDVFYNPNLLTNIREDTKSMSIHCNAGVATTNLIGDLAGMELSGTIPRGLRTFSPCPASRNTGSGSRTTVTEETAFLSTSLTGPLVLSSSPTAGSTTWILTRGAARRTLV